MPHFVIVGAGECGARAAFALREKGFDGDITLIGAELIAPYERPPLSKDGLAHAAEPKFVVALERYTEQRIDLRLGIDVIDIDPAGKVVSLAGGEKLGYDKLLLATGASARPFPGLDATSERIRVLRTHADACALRSALHPGQHITIIGGGFIGLELAATARKLGAEATVIEGLPRVLKRGVPEEIAEVIAGRHRQEGVDIRCGETIVAVEEGTDSAVVRLGSGKIISADLVLIGIGAVPNVALAEKPALSLTTASPSMSGWKPPKPISLRLAIAALSRWRFMVGGGFGWSPGAMHRSRELSPPVTCSAKGTAFPPCRGSGPINMI